MNKSKSAFPIIELAIMAAASGILFISMRQLQIAEELKPSAVRQWPASISTIELAVVALVAGIAVAGPIVLLTRFLLFDRTAVLSAGEWCWLVPTALYLAGLILTNIAISVSDYLALLVVFACVALQSIASIVSLLVMVAPRPISSWSNTTGALSCISAGVLVAYNLIAHPLRI
jgi:hypothetical protein